MEAISLAVHDSFLYTGCVAPRGGISLAQRSAWGLQETPEFSDELETSVREALPRPCGPISSLPNPKIEASNTQRATASTMAHFGPERRRHARLLEGSCNVHEPRDVRRREQGAGRTHPHWLHQRTCVKVGRRHLVCMVFRGHAFVTPCAAHDRRRP